MIVNQKLDDILEFSAIKKELTRYCYSELSREELLNLKTYTDVGIIRDKQKELAESCSLYRLDKRFPIHHYDTISSELKILRIEASRVDAKRILKILNQIDVVIQLKNFFTSIASEFPILSHKSEEFSNHKETQRKISSFLTESGTIRDTASPELNRVRKEIRKFETQLRSNTLSLAKDKYKDYVVDDLASFRNDRSVLAVKAEKVSSVAGVIHDYSGSGSTVYIEPNENVQLASKLQALKGEEQRELDRILREIANILRIILPDLEQNQTLLVYFDVLQSKAQYALAIQAELPQLNYQTQEIELIDMYHPLLLQKEKRENVVPITIKMGDEDSKILLISGPNAGGKTVAIKTLGLAVLMNQSILALPCKEKSSLPIFHKLFCDIGDEQSIMNDLSTFTSHLKNVKAILKEASIDSLVLIDELGTGTDPKEGAVLSKSILQELLKLQSSVLATTHLGELKLFANSTKGVLNASMLFDKEKLESTYRLQLGIPGQSHAFYIAERMGLNKKLIDSSRAQLEQNDEDVEALIQDLSDKIAKNAIFQGELDRKLARAKSMEQMYEKKLKQIQKFERERKEKAIEDAEILLSDVNRKIEKSIREIKENQAEKESIKKSKERIKETKELVREAKEKIHKKASENEAKIEVGDRVRHLAFQSIAEVLEIKSKQYHLQMGNLSLQAKRDEIELFEKKKIDKKHRSTLNLGDLNTSVRNEIDLRGLNVEEAWEKCDEYIEMAISTGWESVQIIHGKGTGVLREALNKFLLHDKRIASKRRGNEGEGDTGVTVLKLRI